jgi:hypothetical protein
MSGDTPPDMRPLERLLASRDYALYHARRSYRPNLMFSGSTLSFRPDMMRRVAAEAPILTEIDRLKRWQIRVPEHSYQTDCEVTFALDFTWISETWNDGLAWSFFNEFPMYVQCTLDHLLDDNPFFVRPSIIMFPRLIDMTVS